MADPRLPQQFERSAAEQYAMQAPPPYAPQCGYVTQPGYPAPASGMPPGPGQVSYPTSGYPQQPYMGSVYPPPPYPPQSYTPNQGSFAYPPQQPGYPPPNYGPAGYAPPASAPSGHQLQQNQVHSGIGLGAGAAAAAEPGAVAGKKKKDHTKLLGGLAAGAIGGYALGKLIGHGHHGFGGGWSSGSSSDSSSSS